VQIEVIPATAEQETVLANLLELYIHDFSEFHEVELGSDGRFGYRILPLYWIEADRYPFLVMVDGRIAGLVLVQRIKREPDSTGGETVWDLAEFFVIRRYRRRGIGTEIVRQVWRRFPGRWQVRVMESNVPACNFWQRAIAKSTDDSFDLVRVNRDGKYWRFFSFVSKGIA
jgi:predicted acetyltransferase